MFGCQRKFDVTTKCLIMKKFVWAPNCPLHLIIIIFLKLCLLSFCLYIILNKNIQNNEEIFWPLQEPGQNMFSFFFFLVLYYHDHYFVFRENLNEMAMLENSVLFFSGISIILP